MSLPCFQWHKWHSMLLPCFPWHSGHNVCIYAIWVVGPYSPSCVAGCPQVGYAAHSTWRVSQIHIYMWDNLSNPPVLSHPPLHRSWSHSWQSRTYCLRRMMSRQWRSGHNVYICVVGVVGPYSPSCVARCPQVGYASTPLSVCVPDLHRNTGGYCDTVKYTK